MHRDILNAVKVSTLAIVISFGVSFVYAWTAPTVAAPGGNVAAPINTSGTAQTKTGDLTVGNLKLPTGGAIFANPTNALLDIVGLTSGVSSKSGINFKNPSGVNMGNVAAYDNSITFRDKDNGYTFSIYNGADTRTYRNNYVDGTTTTSNLIVTNGAGAGKVLTSDANGNATWQTPTGGSGAGCGGGYFIGGITANNPSTHGTVIKNVATGQTLQVTLPQDVKAFVLQGKGGDGQSTNYSAGVYNSGGGGASYAKSGNTWLVVAGGGGGNGIGFTGVGGIGGNFGTKFTDGSFGMTKSTGGNSSPSTSVGGSVGYTTSVGSPGVDGGGGTGANMIVYGYAGGTRYNYGGASGVGPSGNGGSGAVDVGSSFPLSGYGGAGNAGVGGSAGSYYNTGNGVTYYGSGGGGGGYGGGGGGAYYSGAGGGGGGSYLDPRNGWVCEGGVYFNTSDTGYVIDIGSSAGGTGGYVKIIY